MTTSNDEHNLGVEGRWCKGSFGTQHGGIDKS